MNPIKISIFATSAGKKPFLEWQEKLDTNVRAVIKTRLDRVSLGNLGDSKIIKNGVGIWELRINYGPGYRIYFGKEGSHIIILLIGGDKKGQIRDIAKAKKYWGEYKELKYE